MQLFSRGRSTLVAGMAVLALASVACGDDGSSTVSGGAATDPPAMTSPTTGATDMSAEPFGAACDSLPKNGPGSLTGMAPEPVATAASNNPALSTLVTAVTKAKLVDTLNEADDITVFAPIDDAFAALDAKTLDAALADPKGLLTTVLTYHVVPGRLSPQDLAGTHETLEGSDLEVSGAGEEFTVNGGANVVCGNVPTANATVYLIDGVLTPPTM
jgi:uncharacterized surface protein with fasciclin (FAS1) repeats